MACQLLPNHLIIHIHRRQVAAALTELPTRRCPVTGTICRGGGLPLRTRARTPYRDLHPQKSLLAQRPNPKRYPNTEVPEECVEKIRDSGLNGRPPDHAVNRIRLLNVSEACDWSASAFTQHLAELLIKSKSIKGRQEEEEDEEDGRGKCT